MFYHKQVSLKLMNPPASKLLVQRYLFTMEPHFFISLTILSKSNAMSLMMGCPSQAINISWQNYTNGFEIHFPPLLRSTVVPKLSILSSWDKTGSLVDDSEHITKGRCLGPPWCQMGKLQSSFQKEDRWKLTLRDMCPWQTMHKRGRQKICGI